MQRSGSELSKAFLRRLVGGFSAALLATAILVILLHLSALDVSRTSLAETPALNLAGEQAALFERIRSLTAVGGRQSPPTFAQGMEQVVGEHVLRFRQNQDELEYGDAERGIPAPSDPDLIRALAHLRPVVDRVSACAERLLVEDSGARAPDEQSRDRSRLREAISEAEGEFLAAHGVLLRVYESRARAALDGLERRQLLLTLLAFAAIGALGFLFYRPVVRTILRHVEERVAVQRQLEKATRLESLQHFARGIAHDFNNLLVGILGNAEVLMRQIERGSAPQETVERLRDAARRGAHLTHELLAFLGQAWTSPEPLDLNAAVAAAAERRAKELGPGIAVEHALDPDLYAVAADAERLAEVIDQLLANAAESIGEGRREGTIVLTTRRVAIGPPDAESADWELVPEPGEYAELEVRDDGAGLDEATRTRAFDPFFSTKFTGRGLGLASVLGILRSHGGGIRVASTRAPGAAFAVLFPRYVSRPIRDWIPRAGSRPRPAPGPAPVQRETVPRRSGRPLALIVDDEECVRTVVARMLEAAGYDAVLSASGKEALKVLGERSTEISVVFLDIVMAGMSGLRALRALRSIAPGMPIIVSSGYPESVKNSDILDTPRVTYLAKPFLRSDIERALAELDLRVGDPA